MFYNMANNAKATAILDAPYDCVTPFHKIYETFHEPFTNQQRMTGPDVSTSLHPGTASKIPSE
jgi:hypothetical protein